MVSGPGRHPPPSAGTAASRGVGTAGRCAGNSRTLPGPARRAAVWARGLWGGAGRDRGPSPRHGGWREQGRGLWVPRVLGLRLEPRAVPSHAQRFMGSRCRSAGALLSGLSPSTPRRGFSGPNTQVRPGSHAYPQASVLREWGA